MVTIEDWEIKILIDGKEKIGIPLPGCIIEGYIDGKKIKIIVADINMSKLYCFDTNWQKYYLSAPNRNYINALNKVIEFAEKNNLTSPNDRGIAKNDDKTR